MLTITSTVKTVTEYRVTLPQALAEMISELAGAQKVSCIKHVRKLMALGDRDLFVAKMLVDAIQDRLYAADFQAETVTVTVIRAR